MRLEFWKKVVLASFATSLVIGVMSLSTIGQEAKKGDNKAKPGAKEKAKGRLPAYFKDVVTDEQRDQIYAIQAKYEKQLGDLRAQLEGVQDKQMSEIEGLLSAEQKEKLKKIRDEADAKKKADKAKKTDGDKKPAEAAKTTTESEKKPKSN